MTLPTLATPTTAQGWRSRAHYDAARASFTGARAAEREALERLAAANYRRALDTVRAAQAVDPAADFRTLGALAFTADGAQRLQAGGADFTEAADAMARTDAIGAAYGWTADGPRPLLADLPGYLGAYAGPVFELRGA
jgi:hypothetical protein